jgi:aryl-alcohol dehydrogenase-like predicted oxidoreductase
MLPLRPLGSTGLSVSPLGLGTVKLGRTAGVKYPQPFSLPDDAAVASLLSRAESLGINLIDTAPAYGTSEERLGRLLKGRRDRFLIFTKAGETFDERTARSTYDFSPASIRASVERSLTRLATDRLDAVLLHCDDRDEDILTSSGALESLRDLQQSGKVRCVGASTKTPAAGLLAAQLCDVVMLTLNAREQADLPAIRLAAGRGVGVLIKKALASGHDSTPSAIDAAMALALREPAVASVIVGTINPAHLEANAAAAARALSQA